MSDSTKDSQRDSRPSAWNRLCTETRSSLGRLSTGLCTLGGAAMSTLLGKPSKISCSSALHDLWSQNSATLPALAGLGLLAYAANEAGITDAISSKLTSINLSDIANQAMYTVADIGDAGYKKFKDTVREAKIPLGPAYCGVQPLTLDVESLSASTNFDKIVHKVDFLGETPLASALGNVLTRSQEPTTRW